MNEDQVSMFKMAYVLTFAFVMSYCLYWGEIEDSLQDAVDETGWVPDGAFAKILDEPM